MFGQKGRRLRRSTHTWTGDRSRSAVRTDRARSVMPIAVAGGAVIAAPLVAHALQGLVDFGFQDGLEQLSRQDQDLQALMSTAWVLFAEEQRSRVRSFHGWCTSVDVSNPRVTPPSFRFPALSEPGDFRIEERGSARRDSKDTRGSSTSPTVLVGDVYAQPLSSPSTATFAS